MLSKYCLTSYHGSVHFQRSSKGSNCDTVTCAIGFVRTIKNRRVKIAAKTIIWRYFLAELKFILLLRTRFNLFHQKLNSEGNFLLIKNSFKNDLFTPYIQKLIAQIAKLRCCIEFLTYFFSFTP